MIPGPSSLWVVRHAESAGNVARDAAEAQGLEVIDLSERDMDVALSPLGERQARALGRWLADRPQPPTVVLSSPYVRARATASLALEAAGLDLPLQLDERLREREFGVLDRLTKAGITARFPQEAERRGEIGKYYHRPPGGESWTDVLQRVRAVLTDLGLRYAGERVLVTTHQVVVLLIRAAIEGLDEQGTLALDREAEVVNAGVTAYEDRGEGLRLVAWNEAQPIEEEGAPATAEPPVTAQPDRPAPA